MKAFSLLESSALYSLKGQHYLTYKVLVNGENLHYKVHERQRRCERCVQFYFAPLKMFHSKYN